MDVFSSSGKIVAAVFDDALEHVVSVEGDANFIAHSITHHVAARDVAVARSGNGAEIEDLDDCTTCGQLSFDP